MKAGTIWWGQIGNSLRFVAEITNALRDCNSTVLQVFPKLPWKYDLYEAVDIRRSTFSGERRLVRLPWAEAMEPGEFVLDELCSDKVRAEYWPGISYAQYLGSLEDIVLNEYYIWITGIHSKADVVKWSEFISQYDACAKDPEQRAVFVLEYDGEPCDFAGVHTISYSVEFYDCRVFCLEAATALRNTGLKDYQAELALQMGEGDPELCAALLRQGKAFPMNPLQAAQSVLMNERNSEGSSYEVKTDKQLNSAAWKAAIVLLFPIMERYRLDFIENYEGILRKQLPISNSNGERVTDPYDLELGSLSYIVGSASRHFAPAEVENIHQCRKVRNLLAHNKALPYADVVKILALL